MSPREKLQTAYELAFYPPRLNQTWNQIKRQSVANSEELGEWLDMALAIVLGFAGRRRGVAVSVKAAGVVSSAGAAVRNRTLPTKRSRCSRIAGYGYGNRRARLDGSRHWLAAIVSTG